jgi:dUTP pyrophosphatase
MEIVQTLTFRKLDPRVPTPIYGTSGSACFDLAFCSFGQKTCKGYNSRNIEIKKEFHSSGNITISPGDRLLLPTGLIFNIPAGFSVRLHPRSGVSLKKGLTLINCEGVVDEDYVEPNYILVYNSSDSFQVIENLTRLAQAELVRNIPFVFKETIGIIEQKTERIGGFGSTGDVAQYGGILNG